MNSTYPVFRDFPFDNSAIRQLMLDAAKPCGHYQAAGCDFELIPSNVVHPGSGPGEIQFKPYIVQFDIGTHWRLKEKVNSAQNDWGGGFPCIGCEEESETCMEIIIEAGSDATGYCAGKCGSACLIGTGYAKDCLKHDTCIAYKALVLSEDWGAYDDGFCYDPDCGDEAAQAIMNCYIDRSWWPNESIICDEKVFDSDERTYGHWSESRYTPGFDEGPCNNFEEWINGQGIPDNDQIDNSFSASLNVMDH